MQSKKKEEKKDAKKEKKKDVKKDVKKEKKKDIKDDDSLTELIKINIFFAAHWRGLVCIFAPIVCMFILMPFPPMEYQIVAYCLVVMAIYWVTECIPLPVTSFLPIILLPMLGVISTEEVCRSYFNDTMFMFIGSLILAYSVEQSGLHVRLAYCMIKLIGYSHFKLLLSMSIITTFVSMWITNTAATTMMVPINFALLKVFEDQKLLKIYDLNSDGEEVASDFTTCYFCAATYSATIGGIGTLVGTGTNLVFKGLFMTAYPLAPEYLSFPLFSAFTVPLMVLLETFMFLWMIIVYFGVFRPKSAAAERAKLTPEGVQAAKKAVEDGWKSLGRLSCWEVTVIILFGGAMVAFFCRSPQLFKGWGDAISEYYEIKDNKFVRDSALAALVGFLMFLLPSNCSLFRNCTAKFEDELPTKRVRSVLDWKTMNASFPFSFTFLLGGGFALSDAAKKTGLNEKIGEFLQGLKALPNILVLLIIIIVVVFITNFASNVAVCNVVTPISMQLAKEIDRNPLWYNVASGLSASFCFMIPVGTPGNLIVQSAAKIPTTKMMIAGLGPTVTTIIITWLTCYFYGPIVWPVLHTVPEWTNTTLLKTT